jgi:hypothetical protein
MIMTNACLNLKIEMVILCLFEAMDSKVFILRQK